MPQLGEIQRARDIGSNRLNQSRQYIWVDCVDLVRNDGFSW